MHLKTITHGLVYLLLNYHYKCSGYVSVAYEETIKILHVNPVFHA